MTNYFFSYSPHSPPQFHESLDAAELAAKSSLDAACDESGWADDVTEIRYGTVIGQAHETERMAWEEHLKLHLGEEPSDDQFPEFDEWVRYELKDHSLDMRTVVAQIIANLNNWDYGNKPPSHEGCITQLQIIKTCLGKFKP